MKKDKKKPRPRTISRLFERKQERLLEDKQRLARLSPGGSIEQPIVIQAASQLPLRAESYLCLRCDGALRYVDDRVVERDGDLRRAANLTCKRCGAPRELWFQIVAPLLN